MSGLVPPFRQGATAGLNLRGGGTSLIHVYGEGHGDLRTKGAEGRDEALEVWKTPCLHLQVPSQMAGLPCAVSSSSCCHHPAPSPFPRSNPMGEWTWPFLPLSVIWGSFTSLNQSWALQHSGRTNTCTTKINPKAQAEQARRRSAYQGDVASHSQAWATMVEGVPRGQGAGRTVVLFITASPAHNKHTEG